MNSVFNWFKKLIEHLDFQFLLQVHTVRIFVPLLRLLVVSCVLTDCLAVWVNPTVINLSLVKSGQTSSYTAIEIEPWLWTSVRLARCLIQTNTSVQLKSIHVSSKLLTKVWLLLLFCLIYLDETFPFNTMSLDNFVLIKSRRIMFNCILL